MREALSTPSSEYHVDVGFIASGDFSLTTSNLFSFAAIHAEAPEFVEMSVEQEILETGIKVVDLLAPYAKGGKIGKWFFLYTLV